SCRGVACVQGGIGGRAVVLHLPRLRLSGPISQALGSLPYIVRLSLWSNDLSGAIPASPARVTSLHTIFLQYNSLSGPIPQSFLANLTRLDTFDVSGNLLSGPVPVSLPLCSSPTSSRAPEQPCSPSHGAELLHTHPRPIETPFPKRRAGCLSLTTSPLSHGFTPFRRAHRACPPRWSACPGHLRGLRSRHEPYPS
uniref:Uncharacterized protein n=1 Tax=Zea mays TaxID=4577 RepID=A0A804R373_MAIZE